MLMVFVKTIGVDFGGEARTRAPQKLRNAHDFISYCHLLFPQYFGSPNIFDKSMPVVTTQCR